MGAFENFQRVRNNITRKRQKELLYENNTYEKEDKNRRAKDKIITVFMNDTHSKKGNHYFSMYDKNINDPIIIGAYYIPFNFRGYIIQIM